jgi:restriction system protein
MSVPGFQDLMLPLLQLAADKKEHTLAASREELAKKLGLTDEDVAQLLPSGRQTVFANRVAWCKVYMTRAGLFSSVKRGHFQITERGLSVLAEKPARVDIKFLDRFPEFVEFRTKKDHADDTTSDDEATESAATPEETLESAYQRIRRDLAAELLDRVKKSSPAFFEQLVVTLLLRMGYGGSRQDAGKAIGRSGDEGIDGVIHEDRLGLDVIYIQAKRWDGKVKVGRPDIQKFVGALHGKRARKGVFLTTSEYSPDARDYAAGIDSKVALIDGHQLAELMIDFDLGVSSATSYTVKKIDSDFFGEE